MATHRQQAGQRASGCSPLDRARVPARLSPVLPRDHVHQEAVDSITRPPEREGAGARRRQQVEATRFWSGKSFGHGEKGRGESCKRGPKDSRLGQAYN